MSEQENPMKPGKYANCGKELPDSTVRAILDLWDEKHSYAYVGEALNIDWRTAKRYIERHRRQEIARIKNKEKAIEKSGKEYDPQKSLLYTLGTVAIYKEKIRDKVIGGDIPNTITPLFIKQLNDTEIDIIRLPQEIGQRRRDFYEELSKKRLECSDEDYEVLGKFGELDTEDKEVEEAEYEEVESGGDSNG